MGEKKEVCPGFPRRSRPAGCLPGSSISEREGEVVKIRIVFRQTSRAREILGPVLEVLKPVVLFLGDTVEVYFNLFKKIGGFICKRK